MEKQERIVLLADMNAFYASVEQVLNPNLRKRPVIVCGDPARRHGIVLAASYEAKSYGIKTGMSVSQAKELCPTALMVPPHMGTYVRVSVQIINLLREYSPLVEPFSIDEAFVELTGCQDLFGQGKTVACQIQERIYEEIGVHCSIGVGPNKLLAKMASQMKKPRGLTVLKMEDIPHLIWPLPVHDLFGVGDRMASHFHRMGIRTIGDLAHADPDLLRHRFGVVGQVLYESAHGRDNSPVDPCSLDKTKSIGHQFTLPRDYQEEKEVHLVLRELAEQVAVRSREAGYQGRTLSLTLKGAHFHTLHRSLTMYRSSNLGRDLFQTALQLLKQHWDHQPIRLIGITLSNLQPDSHTQLDLFEDRTKEQNLAKALDTIWKKFGFKSIFWAHSLSAASIRKDRSEKIGGHQI